ncbi:ATP-binding protein [uncultured Thiodictyon sp.]|uniref:hybrid sensor histidine kinase/response regulator n=1 Tax=uncultured Thiodictyon sp. TaxID=1846217 RepID=UPI0025F2831F|nr:ATP-binding protein [uncultured Thiodictyon sp.]
MSAQERVPRHPIDLILVEDSATDAELIADALAELGLAIVIRRVEDAPGLTAALNERLPDAILADWTLPLYSGQSALALAHARCPEVPFIFVSGTIPESAAFEALRQGAIDYVLKHQLSQVGPVLTRALDEARAQQSLRESLAFNRTILDSVSAEIAVVDREGVILAVNMPWQRVASENGIEPGQPTPGTGIGADYLAVCWSSTDCALDDDALCAGNGIRAVLDGRLSDFHMELPCHSPQQQRWFKMSVTPLVRDAGGAVITHTDITERKQVEIALQKSRDLLQSVLESVPARVFWKDRDSRYLGCNPQFAKDAGCSDSDDLIGKTDRDLAWADQADIYRADDQAVMASGHPKLNYEEPQSTPDGNRIWLRTSKVSVRDEGHQVIGLLGVYEDITEAKHDAEELDHHRHHLEQLVEMRTHELECARSEADRANRAKSEFLSCMTHELRSPLNAILGFAQLLEFDTSPPTPTQQESITQIIQAGWHLLSLINEILNLEKVESARAPGSLTPVSLTPVALTPIALQPVLLAQVIRECRDMIVPQARQRGIQVTIRQCDTPYSVYADPLRVKQVLINLLSNAIKYNNTEGTGTVEVDCAAAAPGRVRVSVRDTGAGLAPEQLAQLFQAFNRLGQETGGEEGTGIGLVLAKRLVELMGGVIGVDSAIGMGSTFWFELSVSDDSLTAPTLDDTTDAGDPANYEESD